METLVWEFYSHWLFQSKGLVWANNDNKTLSTEYKLITDFLIKKYTNLSSSQREILDQIKFGRFDFSKDFFKGFLHYIVTVKFDEIPQKDQQDIYDSILSKWKKDFKLKGIEQAKAFHVYARKTKESKLYTIIDYAIIYGNKLFIKALKDHGSDFTLCNRYDGKMPFFRLLDLVKNGSLHLEDIKEWIANGFPANVTVPIGKITYTTLDYALSIESKEEVISTLRKNDMMIYKEQLSLTGEIVPSFIKDAIISYWKYIDRDCEKFIDYELLQVGKYTTSNLKHSLSMDNIFYHFILFCKNYSKLTEDEANKIIKFLVDNKIKDDRTKLLVDQMNDFLSKNQIIKLTELLSNYISLLQEKNSHLKCNETLEFLHNLITSKQFHKIDLLHPIFNSLILYCVGNKGDGDMALDSLLEYYKIVGVHSYPTIMSSIRYTIDFGKNNFLKTLLNFVADGQIPISGQLLVHHAAISNNVGFFNICKEISRIDIKSIVNESDINGVRPVHVVLRTNNVDMYKTLVQYGAEINPDMLKPCLFNGDYQALALGLYLNVVDKIQPAPDSHGAIEYSQLDFDFSEIS